MGAMLSVTTKTLFNGLPVHYLALPHVHSAALAFCAHGGPRFETAANHGITHAMEHLLFRGTQQHPSSLSYHRALDDLGIDINGSTHRDAITVHMTVPPTHLAEATRQLAQTCAQPLMTGWQIEREIIREEILDTLDTQGQQLDPDSLSRAVLWPQHAMGQPITGTLDNLDRFTEAQAQAHRSRTFVAHNAVLVIAGPLQPALLHPHVAAGFGALPRGQRRVPPPPPVPPRWAPVQVQVSDEAQTNLLLTYPVPHEHDPEFATLMVLQRILDDGFSSRLRQAICEQGGLAYDLSVAMDAYSDCGALDVGLSCAPDKAELALQETLRILDELCAIAVPQDELRRIKDRHRYGLESSMDDPEALCNWWAANALMNTGHDFESRQRQVQAVGPQDVRRLAQRIFTPDKALLTLVGPVSEAQGQRMGAMLSRSALPTAAWQ